MLMRLSAREIFVYSLTLLSAPLLYGQATGSISGTVTDTSGSPVPGANVTVTAPATGFTRSSKTGDKGEYLVPLLGVATYNLQVELQGFQTATANDVRLQVDEHRELDFKLAPAAVQTSVEVSATAVAIQTTDATLGQVITTQQVADLPLNGRNFVQLATLTPGTAQETNPTSFFNGGADSEVSARGSYSLSVGGSRANSTDWLLDGLDNNELTAGGIGDFFIRLTRSRNSRSLLTTIRRNGERAVARRFWSQRNRAPTSFMARSMSFCATRIWTLAVSLRHLPKSSISTSSALRWEGRSRKIRPFSLLTTKKHINGTEFRSQVWFPAWRSAMAILAATPSVNPPHFNSTIPAHLPARHSLAMAPVILCPRRQMELRPVAHRVIGFLPA